MTGDLVTAIPAWQVNSETFTTVIAPPYDVIDSQQAQELAANKPDNILYVTKPEINFPTDSPSHSEKDKLNAAQSALNKLCEQQVFQPAAKNAIYLYESEQADHRQIGVMAGVNVAGLDNGKVRVHEKTRPDKESERLALLQALNANVSPVMLAFQDKVSIANLLSDIRETTQPLYEAEYQSVIHRLWAVNDAVQANQLLAAMNKLKALYIADGHHRVAAAYRYSQQQHAAGNTGGWHNYFLAVCYPASQLKILPYQRTINFIPEDDINSLLKQLAKIATVDKSTTAVAPNKNYQFGMLLDDIWYQITLHDADAIDATQIPAELLHSKIIAPLFAIVDPRKDPRINFIGGLNNLTKLESAVASNKAKIAFSLAPTTMQQLMQVADQTNSSMPPKSTWFEPKLIDGLLIMPFEN